MDSIELFEPGLENLELDPGPGRSGDQVGGERQLGTPAGVVSRAGSSGNSELMGESAVDFGSPHAASLPEVEAKPQEEVSRRRFRQLERSRENGR